MPTLKPNEITRLTTYLSMIEDGTALSKTEALDFKRLTGMLENALRGGKASPYDSDLIVRYFSLAIKLAHTSAWKE